MKSILLLAITVMVYHITCAQCGAPFYHGVASGDPLSDRVIIWTRVTPNPGVTGSLEVNWRMATDTGMTNIVKSGSVFTSAAVDYTLKTDVTGLNQNTYYYYDFEISGYYSVRGRTHTMPASGTATQRFAQVSCANWEDGYFNAYKRITARNDISAVIFLGDYIYEYKSGDYTSNVPGRINSPTNECISLQDYRTRYASYRLDPDLANCHQQYPWFIIWDDHEFADNAWMNGADNHQPATEGSWATRKANAMEAWREWLPVRLPDPNDQTKIYRKSSIGNLINFYFWDGRMTGRTQELAYNAAGFNDTSRHMLGNAQVNWFLNDITTSTAKWNIVCQQDMMAPCKVFGIPVNTDSWDGYPAERNTLINGLKTRNINNLVVLTGDFHSSWGNDIPRDNYNWLTHANAAGVEFVTPSVTSQSSSFSVSSGIIKTFNPHVQYVDLNKHGYIIINVTSTRVTGEWWYVNTVTQHSDAESMGAAYYVDGTQRHLKAGSMTASVQVTAPKAPACPVSGPPSFAYGEQTPLNSTQRMADVFPNPFANSLTVQYNAESNEAIVVSLIDMQGRTLLQKNYGVGQKGNTRIQLTTGNIPAGTYVLKIQQGTVQIQKIVVKQYGY